jgi:hypothetical protein
LWPPVVSGDWGLVYVTRGHLVGRFVYYDDDEGEDEAIVYMGGPTSACYTVRLTLLRQPPLAGTLRSGLGSHDSEPLPVPAIAPPEACRWQPQSSSLGLHQSEPPRRQARPHRTQRSVDDMRDAFWGCVGTYICPSACVQSCRGSIGFLTYLLSSQGW